MITIETSKKLKVRFTTLVLRIQSILEHHNAFRIYNVIHQPFWGVQNKELFLQHEMCWPPPELKKQIEQLLLPLGMKELQDFVLIQDVPYDYLYSGRILPGTENCDWLESEVTREGCYVWLKPTCDTPIKIGL